MDSERMDRVFGNAVCGREPDNGNRTGTNAPVSWLSTILCGNRSVRLKTGGAG